MPRAPRSCFRFARALLHRASPANPPVLQANILDSAKFACKGGVCGSLPINAKRATDEIHMEDRNHGLA